ncbi:hypothetical protein F4778DRAFT_54806 [Xylariomycetidae sp. FL2044]|nr:hypothetical protein F4778DRAFT_54806 [Xylariomycetidae sp. FL2044]
MSRPQAESSNRPARNVQFRPGQSRQASSIGIRRPRPAASQAALPRLSELREDPSHTVATQSGRRRSSSAPDRPHLDPSIYADARPGTSDGAGPPQLPPVPETPLNADILDPSEQPPPAASHPARRNLFRRRANSNVRRAAARTPQESYDPKIVDVLDVLDPRVSTLNSITNVQNSLFVPSLGRFVNRQPTYQLDPSDDEEEEEEQKAPDVVKSAEVEAASRRGSGGATLDLEKAPTAEEKGKDTEKPQRPPPRGDGLIRLQSQIVEGNYAVLPHGVALESWSQDEIAQVNDYVRHALHSRRSKFKRSMKAFGKYVRKPLGFLITLYATLITLFGLAWVLFLIGWIYVGGEAKQSLGIKIIDYTLVALFGIVGDGLAPFRAIDTYHMIFIARYHKKTLKLRKEMEMPKLLDKNDLASHNPDLEADYQKDRILDPKQQDRLEYHQAKFAKSHTFYKPHETETHHAFPLNFLIAIVVLLDLHSCLQISLGATTWGIPDDRRPMAVTASILSCSIAVNISAGILISLGDRKTRKKDVVERMFRQELTEEAIEKIKEKEEEERKKQEEEERKRLLEEERGEPSRSLDLPRRSLDLWRSNQSDLLSSRRKSEEHPRSKSKPANDVGKFDWALRDSPSRESRDRPSRITEEREHE